MGQPPTFTLKLTTRQRRLVRVQLEAILYFEGSTGFMLPSLGLERMSELNELLAQGSTQFDAASIHWMDELATQLITSRQAFGANEWDRHDIEALHDLRERIEQLTH